MIRNENAKYLEIPFLERKVDSFGPVSLLWLKMLYIFLYVFCQPKLWTWPSDSPTTHTPNTEKGYFFQPRKLRSRLFAFSSSMHFTFIMRSFMEMSIQSISWHYILLWVRLSIGCLPLNIGKQEN